MGKSARSETDQEERNKGKRNKIEEGQVGMLATGKEEGQKLKLGTVEGWQSKDTLKGGVGGLSLRIS